MLNFALKCLYQHLRSTGHMAALLVEVFVVEFVPKAEEEMWAVACYLVGLA